MNKKIKMCILFIGLFILFANSSQAQQTSGVSEKAISSEKLVLIKEYFEVSGQREDYRQRLNTVLESVKKLLQKQIGENIEKDASLTSEQKTDKQKVMSQITSNMVQRLKDEFNQELNYEKLVEDAVYPLLDKYFTEDDLKQLIAIYKSPVWKKLMSVREETQTETSKLFIDTISSTVQKILPRVRDALVKEIRDKSQYK